ENNKNVFRNLNKRLIQDGLDPNISIDHKLSYIWNLLLDSESQLDSLQDRMQRSDRRHATELEELEKYMAAMQDTAETVEMENKELKKKVVELEDRKGNSRNHASPTDSLESGTNREDELNEHEHLVQKVQQMTRERLELDGILQDTQLAMADMERESKQLLLDKEEIAHKLGEALYQCDEMEQQLRTALCGDESSKQAEWKLNEENLRLIQEINAAKLKLVTTETDFSAFRNEAKTNRNRLENTIGDMKEEAKRLRSELQSSVKMEQVDGSEQQKVTVCRAMERLEQQRTAFDDEVKRVTSDYDRLRLDHAQSLRTAERDADNYGHQLRRLEAEKSHLETEKDHLETEKGRLETEKDRLETEKGRLETEKDRLETEKDRLETEKDHLEMENNRLETEKGRLEAEKDCLETQLARARRSRERSPANEMSQLSTNDEQQQPQEKKEKEEKKEKDEKKEKEEEEEEKEEEEDVVMATRCDDGPSTESGVCAGKLYSEREYVAVLEELQSTRLSNYELNEEIDALKSSLLAAQTTLKVKSRSLEVGAKSRESERLLVEELERLRGENVALALDEERAKALGKQASDALRRDMERLAAVNRELDGRLQAIAHDAKESANADLRKLESVQKARLDARHQAEALTLENARLRAELHDGEAAQGALRATVDELERNTGALRREIAELKASHHEEMECLTARQAAICDEGAALREEIDKVIQMRRRDVDVAQGKLSASLEENLGCKRRLNEMEIALAKERERARKSAEAAAAALLRVEDGEGRCTGELDAKQASIRTLESGLRDAQALVDERERGHRLEVAGLLGNLERERATTLNCKSRLEEAERLVAAGDDDRRAGDARQAALKNEMGALLTKLQRVGEEARRRTEEVAATRTKYDATAQALRSELERARRERNVAVATLERAEADADEQTRDAERKLRNENESLRAENAALTDARTQEERRIEEEQRSTERRRQDLEDRLSTALFAKQKEAEFLSEKVEDGRRATQELEKRQQELKEEMEREHLATSVRMKGAEAEAANVGALRERLRISDDAARALCDDLTLARRHTQEATDVAHQVAALQQDELVALQDQAKRRERDLVGMREQMEAEKDRLQAQVEMLNAKHLQMQAMKSHIESELQASMSDHREEVRKLRSELSAMTTERDEVAGRMRKLQRDAQLRREKLESERVRVQEDQNKVAGLEQKLAETSGLLQTAEHRLGKMADTKQQLQIRLAELSEIQQVLCVEQTQRVSIERELETLKEEVSLQKAKESHGSLPALKQQLQSKNSSEIICAKDKEIVGIKAEMARLQRVLDAESQRRKTMSQRRKNQLSNHREAHVRNVKQLEKLIGSLEQELQLCRLELTGERQLSDQLNKTLSILHSEKRQLLLRVEEATTAVRDSNRREHLLHSRCQLLEKHVS
ncbi:PREDICTED: myosin heavy chain, striated muscle-like, partial [Priapulus caudatus]|uniref:Myosin heavy chain, striated muscle-like n=1 Tax=Priapulus caudatus TaxID=37621 RepID=A0ABM1ES39_PRICU